MKTLWLAAVLLWLGLPARGQAFLVDNRPLSLRTYAQLEAARQSVRLPGQHPAFRPSEFQLGPPATYVLRQPHTTPRTQVRYFYSLPDSVVRVIAIEIDSLNFPEATYKATRQYEERPARQAVFAQYHQALVGELTSLLGPPGKDEKAEKARATISYAERTTTWDTPELTADVYSVFTTQTRDVATYRVRATISYKNSPAPVDSRKKRRHTASALQP